MEDFELEQIHFVEKENHRCLTEETIIADGFKQLQTLLQAILSGNREEIIAYVCFEYYLISLFTFM